VILIDLVMPGLAGLETIPHLRRLLPDVGLVALTMVNTRSFREAALGAGADAFVAKSTMRTGLLPAIEQIVKERGKKSAGQEAREQESMRADGGNLVLPYRILLMEDDPSQRRIYTKVLRNAGYTVHEARTMQEARDKLSRDQFGIFLCDIHIGRERGTDLIREQKGRLAQKGTQVVMISADTRYRSLCREMGVKAYLEKPVSLTRLVQMLNHLTGRQRTAAVMRDRGLLQVS
jgi:CheY-like chemotaxis protein